MHYSYNDLPWQDLGGGGREAVVTLTADDTAVQPGSTKHVIYGPAEVTYTRWPDGGIDVAVNDNPNEVK